MFRTLAGRDIGLYDTHDTLYGALIYARPGQHGRRSGNTLSGKSSTLMWVGKAAVFVVGLAVILAVCLWVAYVTLGVGGEPSDEVSPADRIGQLVGGAGVDSALILEPMGRRRLPPQGYAQVRPDASATFVKSKAVIDIERVMPSNSNPPGEKSLYCFDLTFEPHVAVASPHSNNAAMIGTATTNDVPTACPVDFRDASARTYASTSADQDDINFAIVFM